MHTYIKNYIIALSFYPIGFMSDEEDWKCCQALHYYTQVFQRQGGLKQFKMTTASQQ